MTSVHPLLPDDEYNRRLQAHVHPSDWSNPRPSGRYNLVVIGAGTAGLVTAAGAAGLGAKVALVERDLMGGDCLNVGCVPSKAILSAARVAATVKGAGEFGIELRSDETRVDFAAVMRRMRGLRARIAPNDSAARFRDLGVDVYFGQGRFLDSGTLDVEGTELRFQHAVIATGARAAAPPIPGLDDVPYLTNESLFSLTELPRRLGVIGAGPIGCEMAQAFTQLGSTVFLVETQHGILPREDPEAADIVRQRMERDGVRLLCCGRELTILNQNGIRLRVESHGAHYDEPVDHLLVAVGRAANVEDLGLERVGVAFDKRGVQVNDRLRTTNARIYAAGDVCSPYQFTHAADFMARIVIQNALFHGRKKFSDLVIPWCTYTSPELAHVGLTATDAAQRGIPLDTYLQHFGEVDRAILEGAEEGFVKVHVRRGTDRILGATIVARDAGDLISEVTMAMTHRLGLARIGATIHPYPTQADALRRLGDQYNRTRLTPLVKSLMGKWLAWNR
jgi:pyruvate/2-oxoglutarate dehydrogenase complex dihydrolipoamide dehydrogenase (E3) component